MQETFWTLLRDRAHWEFELFLMILFDGLVGAVIWPYLKGWFKHHKGDDEKIDELEKRVRELEDAAK